MNFKIYRDAFKFIVGLAAIGVLGLIYAACVYVSNKVRCCGVVRVAALN